MKEGSQKVCVHLRGYDDKAGPKSRIALRGRDQKNGIPIFKNVLDKGVQFIRPTQVLYIFIYTLFFVLYSISLT